MPRTVRWLQVLAATVFFCVGFLVVLRVTTLPWPHAATGVVHRPPGEPRRPIPEMTSAVQTWSQSDDVQAVWQQRLWYPWLVAAFWLLAMLWARRGAGARAQAGAVLLLLSFAILVLEAAYLWHDYEPFLPGLAGTIEGCAVFALVTLILLYRRPSDRRLDAVEATIASQAILGFAHLLTLPSTMARPWFEVNSVDAVTRAVLENFRPPFWIGCAALLVASVPVYFSRRRWHERAAADELP